MSTEPSAEEEMRRRRFEILGPYANMEFGYPPHQRDRRSPYLKAAVEQQARQTPRTHWLWFFAAAILVIGPLEGLAIWLILK